MGPDEKLRMLMYSAQTDPGAAGALMDYLDENYGDIRRALALSEGIRGVGVLYYPAGNPNAEAAVVDAAKHIKIGSILVLPDSCRFEIVGGNPEQVKVERSSDEAASFLRHAFDFGFQPSEQDIRRIAGLPAPAEGEESRKDCFG